MTRNELLHVAVGLWVAAWPAWFFANHAVRKRLRFIYDEGYKLGREHGFELRKHHKKDIEASFMEAYANARRARRGAR